MVSQVRILSSRIFFLNFICTLFSSFRFWCLFETQWKKRKIENSISENQKSKVSVWNKKKMNFGKVNFQNRGFYVFFSFFMEKLKMNSFFTNDFWIFSFLELYKVFISMFFHILRWVLCSSLYQHFWVQKRKIWIFFSFFQFMVSVKSFPTWAFFEDSKFVFAYRIRKGLDQKILLVFLLKEEIKQYLKKEQISRTQKCL